MAALDMYAERGQWEKCLETASKQVPAARGPPQTLVGTFVHLVVVVVLSELQDPPEVRRPVRDAAHQGGGGREGSAALRAARGTSQPPGTRLSFCWSHLVKATPLVFALLNPAAERAQTL